MTIRPATPDDVPLITSMVRELAEYEKLADQAVATEADFARELFGPSPKAHALIVEHEGQPAGFALYFYNFSTFLAKPGIYLEDVYIQPQHRGHGYGKAMLLHLARLAHQQGCGRFEWSVLDWNQPSIDFYKSLGAVPMDGWTIFRLTGEALETLATA